MLPRVLFCFVLLLYILSFQACSNESNKITSQLQTYSASPFQQQTSKNLVSGRNFLESGSFRFLTGQNEFPENFSYFFQLDSLIYHNEYKKADSLYKLSSELNAEKDANTNEIIQLENAFLGCLIKSKLNDFYSTQVILDSLDIEWKKNDFVSQFYFLKKLQQQSRVWSATGSYQASLSALSYGLYLVETSTFSKIFIRQKANLHFKKANLLMNERGIEFQEAANESFEIAKELFQYLNDTLACNYRIISQANILSQQGEIDEGISLLNSLDTIPTDKNYLQYLYLNRGYLAYENGDTKTAIQNYKKAITYFTNNDCNTRLEILYEYLFYCYLEENNFDSAEQYLNLLRRSETCNVTEQDLKTSYNTQALFSLYQAKYSQSKNPKDKEKAYSNGMKYRAMAQSLFGDENELHLGDMYAKNSSQLLHLFDVNKPIPRSASDWKLVMEILFDSKKLKRISIPDAESKAITTTIPTTIAREITATNDFKYVDHSSKRYKAIFEYFLGSTPKIKKTESGLEKKRHEETPIEIFDLDNPHLIFLAYADMCWKVFIDEQDNITIEKLSLTKLSPPIKRYFQSIIEQKENTELRDSLSEIILPTTDKNLSQLTILPDDVFQNFPFASILSIPHNIDYGFRPHSDVKVKKSKTSIFSYSDEESIKSTNEKEFVELESGLKEAYDVKEILGLTQKIIKDEAFNKANFVEHLSQDIVHISSHAIVKSNVRQNCLLLLNKADGKLDSLFVSEVNGFESTPTFLYLSTCNSGIGYTLQGNGKYSLSQSFMEKGTESILSTLWPVDDKVTRAFSTKYYSNWLKNKTAIQALQATQLEFQQDSLYNQPYFWAGFILEGNGNVGLVD